MANPTIVKATRIDNAWTQLAAAILFAGIARADFETALQDATDAENSLAQAKATVIDLQGSRDAAVATLADKSKMVVNGIKGSPDYGPNSDLYEACGYVKDMDRASGLHRTPTPPTP